MKNIHNRPSSFRKHGDITPGLVGDTNVRLNSLHGESPRRIAAGDAGVSAHRIIAAGFHAGPDYDGGVRDEHGGLDDEFPLDVVGRVP